MCRVLLSVKVGNSPNIPIKDRGWVLHYCGELGAFPRGGMCWAGNELSFGRGRALNGCENWRLKAADVRGEEKGVCSWGYRDARGSARCKGPVAEGCCQAPRWVVGPSQPRMDSRLEATDGYRDRRGWQTPPQRRQTSSKRLK